MFALVVLFSGRAIAPYLRNLAAQKQFITNASHELRAPLTAISTSADVLAMESGENEWVQNIQSQSGRLSRLISSLVTLCRLDEENPFPERTEFSLSDALWEIAEPFSSLAAAKSVLLEPWYAVRLDLPAECVGRAMSDLERMGGAFDPPEQGKTMSTLRGSVPVAQFGDYAREFAAYTKGRGRLQLRPAGYRPCREQEAVAAASGYDPARDIDDPASSIFCTHGAGFEVKWDEVDSYAHLPLLNLRRADEPEPIAAPRKITRSVADGGAPELEKELLAIFERTYGAIRRRDILPMQALRSDDKRELIRALEPAEEFVLVDGYNILFAWDELKELAKSNLDAARHVLMNLLCNYQGYRGCAVILVFDAYKVPLNLGTVEKYHNIFVVYTKEAETADSYIERVTYELRGRRKVRVATSDNLEQLIILGHGAVRVSAKSFHDEVFGTNEEIRRILQENSRKNR